MSPRAHVVHITSEQIILRRGENENICQMYKNKKKRVQREQIYCFSSLNMQICFIVVLITLLLLIGQNGLEMYKNVKHSCKVCKNAICIVKYTNLLLKPSSCFSSLTSSLHAPPPPPTPASGPQISLHFFNFILKRKNNRKKKTRNRDLTRRKKSWAKKKLLFDTTLFYSPVFSKPAICNHGSDHSSEVTCHTKSVIYALPIGLVKHELLCKVQHQHR